MNDMIHVKERGRERSQRLTEKMKGKKNETRSREDRLQTARAIIDKWEPSRPDLARAGHEMVRQIEEESPPGPVYVTSLFQRKISLLYNISFPTLYHYKYTYSLVFPSEPPTLDPLTYHQILILKEILSTQPWLNDDTKENIAAVLDAYRSGELKAQRGKTTYGWKGKLMKEDPGPPGSARRREVLERWEREYGEGESWIRECMSLRILPFVLKKGVLLSLWGGLTKGV